MDYIKSQLKVGVDKDAIKSSLLGTGWNGLDVDDSMKSAAEEGVSPSPVSPASPKMAAGGAPIVVSDLIPNTSKMEIITAKTDEKKPIESAEPKKTRLAIKFKLPKLEAKLVVVVVLAVVTLAVVGAAAYFYVQAKNTGDKLAALTAAGSAAQSQATSLNSQVTDLTNAKNDLTGQVSALTVANQELTNDLSFFVAAPSASTSEIAVAFSGSLAGGGKVEYSLTATSGVRVFAANSKDAKVDTALKPLLGGAAQISGTHVPGSREITVTSVNGASVQ